MVLLLIPAAPLLAQLANNTVTVTASQSSTLQPDEAVLSVTVSSGVDKSLDDVVGAVAGLGITATSLVQISSPLTASSSSVPLPSNVPAPSFGWTFQLVVPFSKLKDTTSALASLQKSIPQNNSGLSLSYSLLSTRVSGQQTPACNLANLVSQARAQAQDTAGAAGFKAGAIVGLTSATSNGPLLGCSLTVRFALGAMFGQPEPVITITATRTNAIQPDQVLIGLRVTSSTTAGLDDITGALTGAGITGANFAGVYTSTIYTTSGGLPTPQNQLFWSFTLTIPLSKLSATLTQVISAQQTISANKSGLTLTFYVEGIQVSPQLQQSQPCSQAALLADAQAQAKQVAAAAGVTVGPILNISEGGAAIAASLQVVPALRTGDFTSVVTSGGLGFASFLPTTVYSAPSPICSLTVQFQLM
jgi:uncharacterized protein YggE